MSTTWINRGHLYAPHVTPVIVDCRFKVQDDDTAGYGITGLKGQGVTNVYMHTSATPATGSPNPAAGFILVHLADNFSQLWNMMTQLRGPASGSDVKIDNSAMTAGVAYEITTLGNATAAKWLAIGVPAGVTPAVGVSFIALTNGGAGNTLTSRVQTVATAGSAISHLELVGDPQLSLAPIPVGGTPHVGGWLLLRALKTAGTIAAPTLTMDSYTPAGTITNGTPDTFAGTPATLTGTISAPVLTGSQATGTPANGTYIRLAFYMSQSSVTVAGE